MLWRLGSALWPPFLEIAALRTLGSRLRILLVLENRPPMSSSASKENARRWRDHFLPDVFGAFSDTAAPFFLLLLIQKKNKQIAAMAATTMGTATAALRLEEHEMLLQEFFDTVTGPLLVLLAPVDAVAVA